LITMVEVLNILLRQLEIAIVIRLMGLPKIKASEFIEKQV
jgi:hypothetical protein